MVMGKASIKITFKIANKKHLSLIEKIKPINPGIGQTKIVVRPIAFN